MTPRSFLYVPGDRAEMLHKALSLGADVVVADLEDGVAAHRKGRARDNVVNWLGSDIGSGGPLRWVRLNASEGLFTDDLEMVRAASDRVDGVSLPKAEAVQQIAHVRRHLPESVAIVALIESARGLVAAESIAAAPGVTRLGMGETDLIADLGLALDATDAELAPIRLRVVVAAAAARLAPPIAGASTNFTDLDSFRSSTIALRRLGFGARSLIHPAQVPVCHEVFDPTRGEVDHAMRVIDQARAAAEAGHGVFVGDDGRMVDEAVVRWARRILDAASVEAGGSVPDPTITVTGPDD